MHTRILVGVAVFIAILFAAAIAVGRSQAASETAIVVRFQRAADDYAFLHRRVQRTLGDDPGGRAMAAAMRAARPAATDGDILTEEIAAVLRARIRSLKKAGCDVAGRSSEILRPNQDASLAAPIPMCMETALPKLPPELEYRMAGVTLVLVDSHANLVVDVVHGAFPVP